MRATFFGGSVFTFGKGPFDLSLYGEDFGDPNCFFLTFSPYFVSNTFQHNKKSISSSMEEETIVVRDPFYYSAPAACNAAAAVAAKSSCPEATNTMGTFHCHETTTLSPTPDESKDDDDDNIMDEKTCNNKRYTRRVETVDDDDDDDQWHQEDERSDASSYHSAQTVTIRIPSYCKSNCSSSSRNGNFNFHHHHDEDREDDLVSIGSKAQMELNDIVAKHETLTTADDTVNDDDNQSECGVVTWCTHDDFVSQSFRKILRSFSVEEEEPISLSAASVPEPPPVLFMETPPRSSSKILPADRSMESQPEQQQDNDEEKLIDDDEQHFYENVHKQMLDQVLFQLVMRCAQVYTTQPTSSPSMLFTHQQTFDRVLKELLFEKQKKNSIITFARAEIERVSQEEEFFLLANNLTSHDDEKEENIQDHEEKSVLERIISMDSKVDSSPCSPAPVKVSELRQYWTSASAVYQTPEQVRARPQLEHTDASTPDDHPVADDDGAIRFISSLDEVKLVLEKACTPDSTQALASKSRTNAMCSILITARLLVVLFLLILGGGMVLARDIWFPLPPVTTPKQMDYDFLALRLLVIDYETGV
jgi:hypothetical protein